MRQRFSAYFDFRLELRIAAKMIENGGLDSAEAEVEYVAAHLGLVEANCLRVPVRRQPVDHWPAGILEREHPPHLVIRFPGSVVPRTADSRVGKTACAVRVLRFPLVKN